MRALLTVEDKTGIETLARGLHALGAEIISTGGTAALLEAVGIPVRTVADVTGYPEILGGRVKTLHPAIHGAILARRDDPAHLAALAEHDITPIDLVACNLRPLVDATASPAAALDDALEGVDIGGAALVRAAAKNFPHVTVVVRPRDYADVLLELRTNGEVSRETRRRLAALAFQHIALYDTAVAAYLRGDRPDELFPEELTVGLRRLLSLRYGENPHQSAALYTTGTGAPAPHPHDGTNGHGSSRNGARQSAKAAPTVAGARLVHGTELTFNNLLDLDAALGAAASFIPPTAVVVKHTNPCGLACADTLVDAYVRAHAGDPISAYGGIVGFNREVDEATAREAAQIFYEAIIAPGFTPEALAILTQRQSLRLLATGTPIGPSALAALVAGGPRLDVRSVSGGLLIQTADVVAEQEVHPTPVTERVPTFEEITDLLFAWKAVRLVKSNAIVLAKKLTVVGVGAGQMNRLYSVEIAVDRAADRARGSVLASDAFFPFPDGVEAAAKAGVTAIIQPGGSLRDDEAIRMANRYGIAMVTTGQRHFRH